MTGKLAVPVLLGTIFINCYIRLVQPAKNRINLHCSPLIPMLVIHKAKSIVWREYEIRIFFMQTLNTWQYL